MEKRKSNSSPGRGLKIPPSPIKGTKQGRKKDHDTFKHVYELLAYSDLIYIKSAKPTGETGYWLYLCVRSGIPVERLEEPDVKKYLVDLDNFISHIVDFLKDFLFAYLHDFTEDKQKRLWLVDVFGAESRMFLPDWESYKRKSFNRPDYDESLKIYLKFLNGESSKALGYGKNKHSNFLRHVVPQAQIKILKGVFNLFRLHPIAIQKEKDAIKQVEELFKDEPWLYRKVVHSIHRKEFGSDLIEETLQSFPQDSA